MIHEYAFIRDEVVSKIEPRDNSTIPVGQIWINIDEVIPKPEVGWLYNIATDEFSEPIEEEEWIELKFIAREMTNIELDTLLNSIELSDDLRRMQVRLGMEVTKSTMVNAANALYGAGVLATLARAKTVLTNALQKSRKSK